MRNLATFYVFVSVDMYIINIRIRDYLIFIKTIDVVCAKFTNNIYGLMAINIYSFNIGFKYPSCANFIGTFEN